VTEVPWTEASVLGAEVSRETWALAARMLLEETARDYHALVTYQELADYVQSRSRIRTRQPMRYWIGDVLFRVNQACAEKREPFLGALCVNAAGSVGDGYQVAIEELRRETMADPDDHAAAERLECYRWFGADLPPGGGEPALAPALQATREGRSAPRPARSSSRAPAAPRARKVAAADVAPKICPTCFMALPANGVCDNCD
jgi:hypothetical protein